MPLKSLGGLSSRNKPPRFRVGGLILGPSPPRWFSIAQPRASSSSWPSPPRAVHMWTVVWRLVVFQPWCHGGASIDLFPRLLQLASAENTVTLHTYMYAEQHLATTHASSLQFTFYFLVHSWRRYTQCLKCPLWWIKDVLLMEDTAG